MDEQIVQFLSTIGFVAERKIADQRGTITLLAKDAQHQSVAIKLVAKDSTDAGPALTALRNEIGVYERLPVIAEYLRHSNGETPQLLWLASRWLGEKTVTLKTQEICDQSSVIQEARLSAFLDLLIAMSEAVTRILSDGYVHADLQARHFIVLDGSGEVKLIDFGIARPLTTTESSIPETGLIHFTAPEVARRAISDPKGPPSLSAASEIYSLGAVMFFLYTGESRILKAGADEVKPYEQQLYEVGHGQFASCKPRQPLEHPPLGELIDQMIAFEPGRRPTPAQVLTKLRTLRAEL